MAWVRKGCGGVGFSWDEGWGEGKVRVGSRLVRVEFGWLVPPFVCRMH